jgi:hypothetical protein
VARVPKQVDGKKRMDLVPWPAIDAVADVMTFGATKYSDRGYYGMGLMGLFAATTRHLTLWVLGQDSDKESGLSHLAHAGANVLMMIELVLVGECTDDRPYGKQDS